jgi:hypothetical protein
MPLCLPARYIPSGMRLSGNSQNLFGIFRETCQVYFLTAPYEKFTKTLEKAEEAFGTGIKLPAEALHASVPLERYAMDVTAKLHPRNTEAHNATGKKNSI